MNIGIMSVDSCLPSSFNEALFAHVNEMFLIENHALEQVVVLYALEQKISVTILPFVGGFTEKEVYLRQIDALVKRCDKIICFAPKDCKQIVWCLVYAKQMKKEMVMYHG